MTITVPSAEITAAAKAAEPRAVGRSVGLVIATLVPAVFWTAVIAAVGSYFDSPLSMSSLSMIGSTIALFLYAICSALMSRA
jgi:hypothetical protein